MLFKLNLLYFSLTSTIRYCFSNPEGLRRVQWLTDKLLALLGKEFVEFAFLIVVEDAEDSGLSVA